MLHILLYFFFHFISSIVSLCSLILQQICISVGYYDGSSSSSSRSSIVVIIIIKIMKYMHISSDNDWSYLFSIFFSIYLNDYLIGCFAYLLFNLLLHTFFLLLLFVLHRLFHIFSINPHFFFSFCNIYNYIQFLHSFKKKNSIYII